MNNKVSLSIDTTPYIPDVFNNTNSLYISDVANSKDLIPTYQTIFIFSMNSKNAVVNQLNKYNDPYYMLYAFQTNFNLPSIKYFFYTSTFPGYTILTKTYEFTPEILELLENIGYKKNKNPDGSLNLFTPTQMQFVGQTNVPADNNILCQKILIYDALTNKDYEIYFIFFYQNYINDNPIKFNNSYIYDTLQKPFQSTVSFEQKNWNVFIYPYTDTLNNEYNQKPNIYVPPYNLSGEQLNSIETINFDNKDYCPYINKIEYKYFENYNFVKNDNKLNTSMKYSKNAISFGDYFEKQKEKTNELYLFSLNEITKNNDSANYEGSLSEKNTIKFLSKSKSYSNISSQFSMSYDNKMSYINNKINPNDLTYYSYNYTNERITTMYPICKNFFINTYIDIPQFNVQETDILQVVNGYIRKILLLINPLIINYEFMTPTEKPILEIYPLCEVKNKLKIDGTNPLNVKYKKCVKTLKPSFNYYIDSFRLVLRFKDPYNATPPSCNLPYQFVYYINLNIAYYNSLNLKILYTNKTSSVDDLGYINYTYLDYSNTLIPTATQKTQNTILYNNLVNYNIVDSKYYSFTINYNQLSSNISQDNLIYLNHFYFLIPYVNSPIYYTNICANITNYPISNVFNLLEKKINNFIMNTIILNNNFGSIKSNNNNAESFFKLSITFDSNIIKDYENALSESCDYNNKNYIEYLQYIKNDFGGDAEIFIEPNTNLDGQTLNSYMIPTGNYLVFKYRNNFIYRDNNGNITPMSNVITENILTQKLETSILNYNFALLIKIDDDFNPDDKFFVENVNLFTTDFRKIIKYFCNQGSYQTKMYLVPCQNNYKLYYYKIGINPTINILLGIELFNYYNGVILNNFNTFNGNKIFINMILNEYMNFYELNFIIDTFETMKQNNNLCFDKNNMLFIPHNNKHIFDIIKYDSLRFNSNIPSNVCYWNKIIMDMLIKNKNAVNFIKVLNNNLIYILNCNKIINLLKRCIVYLTQIKNIIFFENFNKNHPNCTPCYKCKSHSECKNNISEHICKPCFNCLWNIKWKNYFLKKSEYINIINYLATCCININKVNQIINVTYCQEISTVDLNLTNLIYLDKTITIEKINNYILDVETSMIFYAKRIKLAQDQSNELFDKLEENLTVTLDFNLFTFKKEYCIIIKEIYVNNIILYAINHDVIKIFDGIKVLPTPNIDFDEYITNTLIENVNTIDTYKLNTKILVETLNFVRLFNEDETVECIYPPKNNNLVKTNYIYNTEYYGCTAGNNLNNINIYTYFPGSTSPDYSSCSSSSSSRGTTCGTTCGSTCSSSCSSDSGYSSDTSSDSNSTCSIYSICSCGSTGSTGSTCSGITGGTLDNIVKNEINKLITMIADTYKINYTTPPYPSACPMPIYNIYEKSDFKCFVKYLDELIEDSEALFNEKTGGIINKKIYIYSWDIIQKFISNCLEIKVFIKSMFYLNKINKYINKNCLLHYFTNASNFVAPIEHIYCVIKKIITDPEYVITQYENISNLLLKEISVLNTPIFPPSNEYLLTPYNQYSILVLFLKGLYNLKIILLDKIDITIFDKIFKYYKLGYQGEDIIPFNDYNLLIDQRSVLYINYLDNFRFIDLPSGNMHIFNSNSSIIDLIEIFNNSKLKINNYYLSFPNETQEYSLIFNSLNYGYIKTDYNFIDIDNVNY